MGKKKNKRRGRGIAHYKPPKMGQEWQELLQRLAQQIDKQSGKGVMFSLWLFDTNKQVGSQHYFTSSVDREQIIVQLATWLAMQLDSAEIGREPTPADTPSDDVELVKPTSAWLASILSECSIKLPPALHYFESEITPKPVEKEQADGRDEGGSADHPN